MYFAVGLGAPSEFGVAEAMALVALLPPACGYCICQGEGGASGKH